MVYYLKVYGYKWDNNPNFCTTYFLSVTIIFEYCFNGQFKGFPEEMLSLLSDAWT